MSEDTITPRKKRLRPDAPSETKIPRETKSGDRYIIISYAVEPLQLPDWHRWQCVVLYKGMKSDDDLRTYVAEHIKATDPPPHMEIKQSAGEMMETTLYLEHYENVADFQKPLTPLQEETIQENELQPPLYDYEECSVRIRSVRPSCWHRVRQNNEELRETQGFHSPLIITHNYETGHTTDIAWAKDRHEQTRIQLTGNGSWPAVHTMECTCRYCEFRWQLEKERRAKQLQPHVIQERIQEFVQECIQESFE